MQCAIQCLDVIDRRLKGNINIITVSTDLQLLIYSVSQKKVAPLKLFAIFSLGLSIFP